MSVEKFRISKDSPSFTVIQNTVLQNLKDAEVLGVWCYFSSLPDGWNFHKKFIMSHFSIGRDKLDKILLHLKESNLITISNKRGKNGKFIRSDIHVHSGHGFCANAQKLDQIKDSAQSRKSLSVCEQTLIDTMFDEIIAQPSTEKPLTDNQLLINSTYKRNIDKINNKTNKELLSASDDSRSGFDDFWISYPVKKNKVRAEKVWVNEKCSLIKEKIIDDIRERKNKEQQWKDSQYIPHPATYLKNHLWNDEIISLAETQRHKTIKNEPKSTVQFFDDPKHPSYDSNIKYNARPMTVEEIYRATK